MRIWMICLIIIRRGTFWGRVAEVLGARAGFEEGCGFGLGGSFLSLFVSCIASSGHLGFDVLSCSTYR